MSNKKTICQNFIQIVTVGSSSRVKIDTPIFTGNVGIGTSIARAALDIFSTDAILVPVGTETQRPSGMKGLMRYNTTADNFEGYSGSSWNSFGSSSTTNKINISSSVLATSKGWTVTTNNNASSGDFQVYVTPAYVVVSTTGKLVTTVDVLNNSQFNIDIIDTLGNQVSAISTPSIILEYNIIIIKGKNVVLSGLYRFTGNSVTKLS
jgi:hypothetical protein